MVRNEPPHNVEAEQSFLGSALLDPAAAFRVRPPVRPADFYVERHSYIYQAMLELAEKQTAIDLVTLCDHLSNRGWLNKIGGPPYLAELIRLTPTAVHVEHYAKIVRNYARLRGVISVAGKLARLAHMVSDPDRVLAQIEAVLLDLLQNLRDTGNY